MKVLFDLRDGWAGIEARHSAQLAEQLTSMLAHFLKSSPVPQAHMTGNNLFNSGRQLKYLRMKANKLRQ